MSARQAAEADIKQELERCGKCFIAFHEELDPVIDRLVSIQNQKRLIASIV